MAGRIPESIVNEVSERADILEVIGKYVQLKKAGRNFVGLCPFHSEKTPSFSVNPELGIFKCFGCGKGGTVISFLMEIEGMSFVDAVRDLGGRYGIRIETASPESRDREDKREKILSINREAERYYIDNLKGEDGKKAVDYLKMRGVTGETAKIFKIGCAPNRWDGLIEHLRKKKIGNDLLLDAGLVLKGDRGLYDRFRDRIIFPIRDHRDRVLGFGGRIIDQGEPKYMNSPETMVYHKGEVLYGLDITREEIRKAGYAIIVEGYLDLIALYQAGIKNVAATLGTALTREHLKTIGRYTREVILLFDADEAGGKAAERTLPLFGEGKIFGRAAFLPEGEDPDTFINKRGAVEFSEVVKNAPDVFDFCIEKILTRHDLNTAKGASLALEEAAQAIGLLRAPHQSDRYIKNLATRLGVREESIREKIFSLKKTKSIGGYRDTTIKRSSVETFDPPKDELNILRMATNYPGILRDSDFTTGHLDYFENDILRGLIEEIFNIDSTDGEINIAKLLSDERYDKISEKISSLCFIDKDEVEDRDQALEITRDCIKSLEIKGTKRVASEINKRLREGTYDDLPEELLKSKIDNIKKIKR